MNQILQKKSNSKIKHRLILQFSISILFIIIFLIILYLYYYNQLNNEKYSKSLIKNYDILKLYSNNISSNKSDNISITGIIEIPKINVKYIIFSSYTDELLKIAPCKIYGPNPGDYGNLCIASHNYDNDKFFSKVPSLVIGDEIFIYDIYNNTFTYKVFKKYEVESTDSSPIYFYENSIKQLTLITCNNINKTRFIINAKTENT